MRVGIGLALAAVALTTPGIGLCAGAATDGVRAFKSGAWSVYRTSDAMNDKTVCTGVYNPDPTIQLAAGRFYVGITGGVDGVEMRFDNEASIPMRTTTDREKRLSRIVIEGADFDRLMASSRLRLYVIPISGSHQQRDIDLRGATGALANIEAGCPGSLRK